MTFNETLIKRFKAKLGKLEGHPDYLGQKERIAYYKAKIEALEKEMK